MKATIIFRADGTVQLKDIEKVSGTACSKTARKLASTLPGEVQKETVEKTKNYYVQQQQGHIRVGNG